MADVQRDVVTLYQMWHWTCPRCKNDYYAEMVPAELNEEERVELAIRGVYCPLPGDFVTKPSVVECCVCDIEYATVTEFEE